MLRHVWISSEAEALAATRDCLDDSYNTTSASRLSLHVELLALAVDLRKVYAECAKLTTTRRSLLELQFIGDLENPAKAKKKYSLSDGASSRDEPKVIPKLSVVIEEPIVSAEMISSGAIVKESLATLSFPMKSLELRFTNLEVSFLHVEQTSIEASATNDLEGCCRIESKLLFAEGSKLAFDDCPVISTVAYSLHFLAKSSLQLLRSQMRVSRRPSHSFGTRDAKSVVEAFGAIVFEGPCAALTMEDSTLTTADFLPLCHSLCCFHDGAVFDVTPSSSDDATSRSSPKCTSTVDGGGNVEHAILLKGSTTKARLHDASIESGWRSAVMVDDGASLTAVQCAVLLRLSDSVQTTQRASAVHSLGSPLTDGLVVQQASSASLSKCSFELSSKTEQSFTFHTAISLNGRSSMVCQQCKVSGATLGVVLDGSSLGTISGGRIEAVTSCVVVSGGSTCRCTAFEVKNPSNGEVHFPLSIVGGNRCTVEVREESVLEVTETNLSDVGLTAFGCRGAKSIAIRDVVITCKALPPPPEDAQEEYMRGPPLVTTAFHCVATDAVAVNNVSAVNFLVGFHVLSTDADDEGKDGGDSMDASSCSGRTKKEFHNCVVSNSSYLLATCGFAFRGAVRAVLHGLQVKGHVSTGVRVELGADVLCEGASAAATTNSNSEEEAIATNEFGFVCVGASTTLRLSKIGTKCPIGIHAACGGSVSADDCYFRGLSLTGDSEAEQGVYVGGAPGVFTYVALRSSMFEFLGTAVACSGESAEVDGQGLVVAHCGSGFTAMDGGKISLAHCYRGDSVEVVGCVLRPGEVALLRREDSSPSESIFSSRCSNLVLINESDFLLC